jgi:phosphotransferase system  glucose/maltose/N-acetylglucosamine-specific IIC component
METADTYSYLFFGYSTIWAIIVFFVFRMIAEQRRIARDLSLLRSSVASVTKDKDPQ